MIQFILNGRRVSYDGCAADRLLDVLRDQFGSCAIPAVLRWGRSKAQRFSVWKVIAKPRVLPR